jgi:phage terminase large subunit-like protein
MALAAKATQDHVPYVDWVEKGYLLTTPGATVSYDYIAKFLFTEIFPKYRIAKIGFDRWNFTQFKPCLLAAGFTETVIAEKFVEFGQGTASMTPALRQTEELILSQKLQHGGHPLLASCIANAVVDGDDSNRKLSKKRSTGRIDVAIALVMAVGVSPIGPTKFDPYALIG